MEYGTIVSDACSIHADDEVRCVSPAGVGTDYHWSLFVAAQPSSPSTQTTSFAPPTVLSFTTPLPGGTHGQCIVATVGGTTVSVAGTNFPRQAADAVVTWNGALVPGVVVTVPFTKLQFPSPAGSGGAVTITVTVSGQAATVSPSVQASVSYGPPAIIALTLQRDEEVTTSALDCSVVDDNGLPATAGAGATLAIDGVNFGANASTVSVAVHGVPCALRSVTHTRIVCTTVVCAGTSSWRWPSSESALFATAAT